jgi:hypothetical protein
MESSAWGWLLSLGMIDCRVVGQMTTRVATFLARHLQLRPSAGVQFRGALSPEVPSQDRHNGPSGMRADLTRCLCNAFARGNV